MALVAVRGWPLAALGVSRLFVIKGLGYQEHESEYGVHWNFFATLYCVRLLVALMAWLHPAHLSLCLALLGLLFYQKMLSAGLSDYIEHAPRDTLFSMNREGVLGIVGFVAIYFIAEELGSYIQTFRRKSEKVSRQAAYSYCRYEVLVALSSLTVVGPGYFKMQALLTFQNPIFTAGARTRTTHTRVSLELRFSLWLCNGGFMGANIPQRSICPTNVQVSPYLCRMLIVELNSAGYSCTQDRQVHVIFGLAA